MLNCFVLAAPLKTITRFLLLPTFYIRVAVAIITPTSLPLSLSPPSPAVYCLFSHSSLLYNRSRTLIYHWLTLSCLHYLPFLSWCTGTLQIQLNLLRYCSFRLMHPSFKVERFLILPLISVLPHLSAVSGLMQKCCIN